MTCGTCTHFKPQRDAAGNELSHQAGECTYPVIWPAVPKAYYQSYAGGRPFWPQKHSVYRKESAGCEMYQVRKK